MRGIWKHERNSGGKGNPGDRMNPMDRENPGDISPFSHGVFFVSRLTAVGHMRHPFKADLGEK